MKSKFKPGDRVTFTWAGKNYGKKGLVEYVRKDGNVIVHFDNDPPGTILVVLPFEISREPETAAEPPTRLKANEIRERLKARGYQVKATGRAGIRGPWEAWAAHRDLPILSTSGHASQIDALRALFDKAAG